MDGVRDAFTGFAILFLGALAIILITNALHHSHPHGCVRPTALPPTWFGECGGARFNTKLNFQREK